MDLAQYFDSFLFEYVTKQMDEIWESHSVQIQKFWKNYILSKSSKQIKDESIDRIIMILDRNGKGNTKETESVGRVMVPQNAWRNLFREFINNSELSNYVYNILQSNTDNERIKSIDHLYEINFGKNNYLTGKSGSTISAFLAGWDAKHNLSIVSLTDRYRLIEYSNIDCPKNLKNESLGKQIVLTNKIIINYFAKYKKDWSARTISRFVYSDRIVQLWKKAYTIVSHDGEMQISIPTDNISTNNLTKETEENKDSIKIQAQIAKIGAEMGYQIWIPKSDRKRVLKEWVPNNGQLLEHLPLNYVEVAIKTIENIDVLWIKNYNIDRAFEVEHTTSIYSGLLRMADLKALMPNIVIKLYISAPKYRKLKVFEEINRPVFSLLQSPPLKDSCFYISYDSITELANNPSLKHIGSSILDELSETSD